MNAAQLVDRIVEGDEDIDPSELVRQMPDKQRAEPHVPASMRTDHHQVDVNFGYVLMHNYRFAIGIAGMLTSDSSYANFVGQNSVDNDTSKHYLVVRMRYRDNMMKAARVCGAPDSFLSYLNQAAHLEFLVDREALLRWFKYNGFIGEPDERSFPIGEAEEPDPSELASQVPGNGRVIPATMFFRIGGTNTERKVNFAYVMNHWHSMRVDAAILLKGMKDGRQKVMNTDRRRMVLYDDNILTLWITNKADMRNAANMVDADTHFIRAMGSADALIFNVDADAATVWLDNRIGESEEPDPSELAAAVPDSKWRIARSETDKHGRRWIEYQHTCGVSFELKNIWYGTPTFGRSMLKVWNISVYDPDGKYIDGAVNIKASTPEKAFEEGKTWTAKLLRDYSRGFYRAVIAESDDPLDPSALAATLPDYVNGILSVDDSDAHEEPPPPVRVNAVFYLQTKSHRWLKQMRHHASYGGSPSVSFETDIEHAQPWTYAVLLHAPEEFVEFVKRNDCPLQLEMDRQRMLDWIAAWLAKPQL